MLSIPRDSRVMVNGKLDKINHAHHYGGLKMAMKTTRDFLNLDIDYYVRVNFFSVKDIVDVLGGIEVDVPVQVDVAEDNIHLKPGKQILMVNKLYNLQDLERDIQKVILAVLNLNN